MQVDGQVNVNDESRRSHNNAYYFWEYHGTWDTISPMAEQYGQKVTQNSLTKQPTHMEYMYIFFDWQKKTLLMKHTRSMINYINKEELENRAKTKKTSKQSTAEQPTPRLSNHKNYTSGKTRT